MTLKDQMAADLANVMAADEFDEAGTYFPKNSASSFAVRLVRGDIQGGASVFGEGVEHARTCDAVLIRSVVRAGVLAITGAARDPVREDKITLSDGDWYVVTPAQMDIGGGLTVQLEFDTFARAAGTGAIEAR